jgi:hypothetical protein
VRLFGDFCVGALRRQHPDRNLQALPGRVNDADRPIAPLRSAKDLKRGAMQRVKGVEDLNICIIATQGILGVGAIIRTFTV